MSQPQLIDAFELDSSADAYLKDAKRYVVSVKRAYLMPLPLVREALAELSHICWLGGSFVQSFVGKQGVISSLREMFSPDWLQKRAAQEGNEDIPLHMKRELQERILQCFISICQEHRPNQRAARRHGWLFALITALRSNDLLPSLRRHIILALFTVTLNNGSSQTELLLHSDIADLLVQASRLEWRYWKVNYAEELMIILGFEPPKNRAKALSAARSKSGKPR